jgi:hypothetical protein
VLPCIARRLRELPSKVLDEAVDLGVQLLRWHRAVDEPPFLGLLRGDLLAEQDDLARAPVADHDRQPLRRAAGRNGPVLGPDVTDEGAFRHDSEVAGHLELVATADANAVDPRDRRLAHLPQAVVRVLERSEPLPVLTGLAEVVLAPRLEVGADAEGPAGPGEDDDAEGVVPGGVLARAGELTQHPEVEGVEDLWTVERDRGARRRLLVDDRLKAERLRIARLRAFRLGHSSPTSEKWTWKGMPMSAASFPVAANSSVRAAALKASMSGKSHSA